MGRQPGSARYFWCTSENKQTNKKNNMARRQQQKFGSFAKLTHLQYTRPGSVWLDWKQHFWYGKSHSYASSDIECKQWQCLVPVLAQEAFQGERICRHSVWYMFLTSCCENKLVSERQHTVTEVPLQTFHSGFLQGKACEMLRWKPPHSVKRGVQKKNKQRYWKT